MNLVAELIISKTVVMHLANRLGLEKAPGLTQISQELNTAAVSLDRVSKEIQEAVLEVRMVQMKTVFSKFPRMIRDLSKKSGKKIRVDVVGEDTEVDKSIVEQIGDPMIHLIRNAVDHGMEMPQDRIAAGKPETGVIALRARHEGNNVIIEIEEDGAGIDPDKIANICIKKGLITQEKVESLTDIEKKELIFMAGFSTAEQVSDISGRGVGMDVVRSNILKLNGRIQIDSEVGRGTKFVMQLPLTLAIIEALLVKVGDSVFAVPGTSVEETLKIHGSQISTVSSRPAINVRGEVLGIAPLTNLLMERIIICRIIVIGISLWL